jgi:hypothetical protein
VVVKLMIIQVTKLPLWHTTCKIGMIYSVKPVLTEDFCVVEKEEFSNMLYVQNVQLTKAKHIHKRQSHLLVREDVT